MKHLRNLRRSRALVSTCGAVALLLVSGGVQAADMELPFGMSVDHLNLVVTASEVDATVEFYGDALGLERPGDWKMPSGSTMLRFLAGDSELKFIVPPEELPAFEGSAGDARGIRLLALLLPASQQKRIEQRFEQHGYPAVKYTHRANAPIPYSFGMAWDPDGNQVEIVFLDDSAPADVFRQVQIGLTVSDAAAMNEFLADVIGLTKVSAQKSPSSGAVIHRYAMGVSQIKFWQGREGLPAHVGSPYEIQGMSLLQFIVPDVDIVRATVLERGGKIHTEPYALGKSTTIMFVEGPDGILFEFAGPLLPRLAASAE